MKTTQSEVVTPQDAAPLSAEPGDPVWMYLKSERVQEPTELTAVQAEGKGSHVCELAFSHPQPMTIELAEPQIFIHVYGTTCGSRAKA